MSQDTPAGPGAKQSSARRVPRTRALASERARIARELRDVDFPLAMRGYDRSAVDRYVEQVNRVIAELEVSASPESAVRHALEEVTEETRGLLEQAHETAEEITARSRARADDRLQQGKREAEQAREAAAREAEEVRVAAAREAEEVREAARRDTDELRETAARESQSMRERTEREVGELRARSQARLAELDRNAQAILRERQRLIESVGEVARELQAITETEAVRFPRPEQDAPREPDPPRGEGAAGGA